MKHGTFNMAQKANSQAGRWGEEEEKTLLSPRPESLYDDITLADNAHHFFIYNI
jgi:hypothetical protein